MTTVRLLRCLQAGLALALALLCPAVLADTPVSLFKSFAGYVSFTGTEATMRTSGTQPCAITTGQLSKPLTTIPAGAKILYARLYWAGSATTVDTQVTLNSTTVNADQTYTTAYTTGGVTYNYFAAAADVTAIVKAKGNGAYTFANLTVSNGNPWCAVEGVLGGFALLVVYEDPATQPFRVLNVYEGFQYTRDSSLTLSLSNFRVPNPIGNATGRIGHITWEGDDSLSGQGENLVLNGTATYDSMNPIGNQFNSKSNIDGDAASWGIDFDAYTVGSPVIQPDQTTATTVYSSGQDLVLLSAEIVAVPNVPTDDLALTMTRSGQTTPGQTVSYALQVQNNGPTDELGPITVTNTLPAGMGLASYSGAGWSCSASGQVVTCTRGGPLAAPVSPAISTLAPLLTLNVAVSASSTGIYTNSATVAGVIFDNVSGNNTDSDTASDPTLLQGAGMILTDKPCTDGVALTSPSSPCKRITAVTANLSTAMYITNVDANGVPKAPKTSGNTKYDLNVSLTCVNPGSAGTLTATFAGGTLPKCFANGVTPTSTTSLTLRFTGPSPSANLSGAATMFQYADVGVLQLNFTDLNNSSVVRTARFVSQPVSLSIAVKRTVDGVLNPGTNVGNTFGFVKAGEPFTVTIGALMSGGGAAPSFGKESPPAAVSLGQSQVGQGSMPPVSGTSASAGNGTIAGDFTYKEVGDISLSAKMASPSKDYLGSGSPVADSGAITVGRFYPAYFETATSVAGGGAITPGFICQTPMACPTLTSAHGESLGVSGAVYSGQAFTVTVTPKALDGTVLANYQSPYSAPISLTAVSPPGYGSTIIPASVGTLSQNTIAVGSALQATPIFTLAPLNGSTRGPTAVYLNAIATQARAAASGSTADPVNSNRGQPAVSVEGGVMVVAGRLQVADGYGSELLRLPLQIRAQYWTGSAWVLNPGDSGSVIGVGASPLAVCSSTIPYPGTLSAPTPPSQRLQGGIGTIYLPPPGAGKTGCVKVTMNGSLTYLPSTSGMGTFGVYKSRVIYIREVY